MAPLESLRKLSASTGVDQALDHFEISFQTKPFPFMVSDGEEAMAEAVRSCCKEKSRMPIAQVTGCPCSKLSRALPHSRLPCAGGKTKDMIHGGNQGERLKHENEVPVRVWQGSTE